MTQRGKSILGRVREALGWATADRREEAAGQLEQLDAADPAPKPSTVDPEQVLDEAELDVRGDHGDLAPGVEQATHGGAGPAKPPRSG
ncbi:MAG TPA: hypothetical protein VGM93_09585 [Acidimicrobiales bacterium]